MSEWQPIETAPRDGTAFLAACQDNENISLAILWYCPRHGLEGTKAGQTARYWYELPPPPKEMRS